MGASNAAIKHPARIQITGRVCMVANPKVTWLWSVPGNRGSFTAFRMTALWLREASCFPTQVCGHTGRGRTQNSPARSMQGRSYCFDPPVR
jgi:hypothetical protein